jgi:hypothetical protein
VVVVVVVPVVVVVVVGEVVVEVDVVAVDARPPFPAVPPVAAYAEAPPAISSPMNAATALPSPGMRAL